MLMLVFSYKLKPVYDQIIKKTDTLVDVFRHPFSSAELHDLNKLTSSGGDTSRACYSAFDAFF
jgi:hypothetical protein